MVPALLALSVTQLPQAIPGLGKVEPFDLPPGAFRQEDGGPLLFTVSNSGDRVYQFSNGRPTELRTWPTDRPYVWQTRIGASYDTADKRARIDWQGMPSRRQSSTSLWLNLSDNMAGLWDDSTPIFWRSGSGENGITASALCWLDVEGEPTGGIAFFNRKNTYFVGINPEEGFLAVRDYEKNVPGKLHIFSLNRDYRLSKELPLTKEMKRLDALGGAQASRVYRTISANWRWAVDEGTAEVDLKTGKRTPIPKPSNTSRYLFYLGNDLFFIQEIDVLDKDGAPATNSMGDRIKMQELWMYVREEQKITLIGGYEVLGSSPNGRYVVIRPSHPDHRTNYALLVTRPNLPTD